MAEKLAKKAAPAAKPAKAEKAEKVAGARKGNPEALAKAREAKAASAGPDTRKLTVVKGSEPTYREGSNRATAWAATKGAKTVQDYKDAGGVVKYLARWEAEGAITLK